MRLILSLLFFALVTIGLVLMQPPEATQAQAGQKPPEPFELQGPTSHGIVTIHGADVFTVDRRCWVSTWPPVDGKLELECQDDLFFITDSSTTEPTRYSTVYLLEVKVLKKKTRRVWKEILRKDGEWEDVKK